MFVRKKKNVVQLLHSYRAGTQVRQRQIQSWPSHEDLAAALASWPATLGTLKALHPDLDVDVDWEDVRAQLQQQLDQWPKREKPGSTYASIVSFLTELLRGVTPVLPAGKAIVEGARPELEALLVELERVLGRTPAPELNTQQLGEADEQFDQGMELWWNGDRPGACKVFIEVLQRDPLHADAHNHLAIVCMDEGRLQDAEHHLLRAIEGGARHIEVEDGFIEWSWIENRPYLRAHQSLGLLRSRQGRHDAALRVYQQILQFNPNDNQGIRYLVPECHHRTGDLQRAITAYEQAADEPGSMFGLALALRESDRPDEACAALIGGHLANRYIGSLLLSRRVRRHGGRHLSHTEDVSWAQDYVNRCGDLWRRADHLTWLASVLDHPATRDVREQMDALMLAANDRDGDHRAAFDRQESLAGAEHRQAVARAVLHGDPVPPTPGPAVAPRGALIAQLQHYARNGALPPSGSPARRMADFLGAITQAALRQAGNTDVPCRRRPERRPCSGRIHAERRGERVVWACPVCGDHGQISRWEGTPWVSGEL